MHASTTTLPGFSMGSLMVRPFGGDQLMVVRIDGPAGTLAPAHAHEHEQMTLIVAGRVRFRVGDERVEVAAGDVVHIPPGVEHAAELLEDACFYDIFHPVREDFLQRVAGEA